MQKKVKKMMVLFVSVLLFLSHFSASFPLKGFVYDPGENPTDPTSTTHLPDVLRMTQNTPTSSSGESGFSPISLLVSVFIALLLLSIWMLATQESQPGGVLGSLIHYPAHSLENTMKSPETKLPH